MAKRTSLRTADLLNAGLTEMREDANMTAQAEQDALDAIAKDPELTGVDEVTSSEMGAYLRPDLAPTKAQIEQYANMTPIERIAAKAEARARESEIHQRIASKVDKPSKRVVEGKVAEPKVAKEPKAKKVTAPKECECGCGKLTAGGRFVPGHDATLKSRLIKVARATQGESIDESTAAWSELERLGWSHLFDREDTEIMAVMNRKKAARKAS